MDLQAKDEAAGEPAAGCYSLSEPQQPHPASLPVCLWEPVLIRSCGEAFPQPQPPVPLEGRLSVLVSNSGPVVPSVHPPLGVKGQQPFQHHLGKRLRARASPQCRCPAQADKSVFRLVIPSRLGPRHKDVTHNCWIKLRAKDTKTCPAWVAATVQLQCWSSLSDPAEDDTWHVPSQHPKAGARGGQGQRWRLD